MHTYIDYVALFSPVRDENKQLYNNYRWNTAPEHQGDVHWNQSHQLFKARTARHLCYTRHRETPVHGKHSHIVGYIYNADNKRGNDKSYKSPWLQQTTMLFKNTENEREHSKIDFLNFLIQLCWFSVISLIYFQIRKESNPHEVISLLCFRETCFIVWATMSACSVTDLYDQSAFEQKMLWIGYFVYLIYPPTAFVKKITGKKKNWWKNHIFICRQVLHGKEA